MRSLRKRKQRPPDPQNVKVNSFTDVEMELTWDAVMNANVYNVYVGDEFVKTTTEPSTVVDGLTPFSPYSISISASNLAGDEGEKATITQRTRISKPSLTKTFYFGEMYILATTISSSKIIQATVSSEGGTYIATGAVTNGDVKIYAAGNPNILAGNKLLINILDGTDSSKVQGMPLEIIATIPTITLNPVTTAGKNVSGVTSSGIQVRVSQNGVSKTIVTADADGNYAANLSTCAVGDEIKVETKVGSTYSSNETFTVEE